MMSYPYVKSLQLIWRSGTRRWNLRVPDLQMSCRDLTLHQSTRIVVPAQAARRHAHKHWQLALTEFENGEHYLNQFSNKQKNMQNLQSASWLLMIWHCKEPGHHKHGTELVSLNIPHYAQEPIMPNQHWPRLPMRSGHILFQLKQARCSFHKRFHCIPNSMQIWLSCNSIADYDIATPFHTCHDSAAVMPCTKFHSNHLNTTWMRAKWNFYRIWNTMENL